jgi:hypothetical protein
LEKNIFGVIEMPEKITYTVDAYKFGELSKDVQTKVISKMIDDDAESGLYIDDIREDIKRVLDERGFSIKVKEYEHNGRKFTEPKIYFDIERRSISWDGSAEAYRMLRLYEETLKGHNAKEQSIAKEIFKLAGAKVGIDAYFSVDAVHNGDLYEVTVELNDYRTPKFFSLGGIGSVESTWAFEDAIDYLKNDMEAWFKGYVAETAKLALEAGQETLDWVIGLDSDDRVKGDIEANDYKFTKEGKII